MMEYAIEVLTKEYNMIKKCLNNFDKAQYPEAKKRQEKKLKHITNALGLIIPAKTEGNLKN